MKSEYVHYNHEDIIKIITEAVCIEKEFITESLSCELIGMNASLMMEYIEYIVKIQIEPEFEHCGK